MQIKHLCVLTHIWTKSEVCAPWHQFKPSSKILLLTVSRRCFFCGSFMLFLSCFCYAFVRVCLLVPCGHLLGKGWPLGSRLWCLTVILSLSHRYPWSGAVLDCIDSWSLPPFLLLLAFSLAHIRVFTGRSCHYVSIVMYQLVWFNIHCGKLIEHFSLASLHCFSDSRNSGENVMFLFYLTAIDSKSKFLLFCLYHGTMVLMLCRKDKCAIS